LPNRDGRRNAADFIHVRLVHPLEKLARVSRQGFHVSALSFGVNRIERQRGFT
jgi:hypothetical protein